MLSKTVFSKTSILSKLGFCETKEYIDVTASCSKANHEVISFPSWLKKLLTKPDFIKYRFRQILPCSKSNDPFVNSLIEIKQFSSLFASSLIVSNWFKMLYILSNVECYFYACNVNDLFLSLGIKISSSFNNYNTRYNKEWLIHFLPTILC